MEVGMTTQELIHQLSQADPTLKAEVAFIYQNALYDLELVRIQAVTPEPASGIPGVEIVVTAAPHECCI